MSVIEMNSRAVVFEKVKCNFIHINIFVVVDCARCTI